LQKPRGDPLWFGGMHFILSVARCQQLFLFLIKAHSARFLSGMQKYAQFTPRLAVVILFCADSNYKTRRLNYPCQISNNSTGFLTSFSFLRAKGRQFLRTDSN